MNKNVQAVFFDIGETLVNEQRMWACAADVLGISHLELFAAIGSSIECRERHEAIFERFGLKDETVMSILQRHSSSEAPFVPLVEDLYPDAMTILESLKSLGLYVGIAGNQPPDHEAVLRSWGLPADCIGTSGSWGVGKPSPRFFEQICKESGIAAEQIMYVGDRVDNDVLPAKAAGMVAVLLRRGPWGGIQAGWPEAQHANHVIGSLSELIECL
jgi:HAD superfamily hydrolase (TIGR01549 family)